jgi:hypothetical protein
VSACLITTNLLRSPICWYCTAKRCDLGGTYMLDKAKAFKYIEDPDITTDDEGTNADNADSPGGDKGTAAAAENNDWKVYG